MPCFYFHVWIRKFIFCEVRRDKDEGDSPISFEAASEFPWYQHSQLGFMLKHLNFSHILYWRVLCGSYNKRALLVHIALDDWSFWFKYKVFSVKYEIILTVMYITSHRRKFFYMIESFGYTMILHVSADDLFRVYLDLNRLDNPRHTNL